ncbi:MAG: lipid II flippase MurJ, partial [Candidatus Fermentibacteria bacterium]
KTLGRATLALAALMIPATLCMIFLARPVVQVLLARGAFTVQSTLLTSSALIYYSAGLLFYGAVKITVPVFYAMKDTKTPVKIAVSCMGLNIILNFVFTMFFIKTSFAEPLAGLALATSVSAIVNFFLLRVTLRKKTGGVVRSSTPAWLSMIPSAAVSFLFLKTFSPWASSTVSTSTFNGVIAILAVSIGAIISFLAVFALAGGKGARSVFSLAFRRGSIKES